MWDDESILTWLDLTLAYIFDHAVCCVSAASLGRSLHLITSQLRTKSSLDCPNHVRRTKSSIKKRIIVRRTVRSMFSEQTFAQLRTGLMLLTAIVMTISVMATVGSWRTELYYQNIRLFLSLSPWKLPSTCNCFWFIQLHVFQASSSVKWRVVWTMHVRGLICSYRFKWLQWVWTRVYVLCQLL